ncbi:MAG: hypothetical protein ACRDPV_04660 [Gaiellaceae bacterium]
MRRRMPRPIYTTGGRRLTIRERIVGFVRALFSSKRSFEPWDDGSTGGLGVREPRRPLRPTLSGAVALDLPLDETRDLWTVGEDRD